MEKIADKAIDYANNLNDLRAKVCTYAVGVIRQSKADSLEEIKLMMGLPVAMAASNTRVYISSQKLSKEEAIKFIIQYCGIMCVSIIDTVDLNDTEYSEIVGCLPQQILLGVKDKKDIENLARGVER